MERKIGSVGTPVWGVELKVVDGDGRELPAGEAGEMLGSRPQRDQVLSQRA